jgi:Protein of unknown function/AsmA-like C-terminal region
MVYASSGTHLDNLEDANSLVNDDVQPRAGEQISAVDRFPEARQVAVTPSPKAPRRVAVVSAKRLAPLHETFAVGFALTGLIAGYLAWRLSEGTISIAAATPIVESALERIVGGQADIGELRLGWDKDRRDFVVTANKITATTDARTSPLALGEVSLTLNAQALLAGKAQITSANLTGLQAVLVLDKEGRMAFGFGTAEEVLKLPRKKSQSKGLRSILDSVRRSVLPDGENGRVDAIALRNALLIIIDPDTGERLTLVNALANVTTDANNIVTMQAAGFAREMGGAGNIAVSASPDISKRLVLAANFDRVLLAKLPTSLRAGPLARVSNDSAPISGDVLVRLGDQRVGYDVKANLVLGQGRFQGLDLVNASSSLTWDGQTGSINVSNLTARAAQGKIDAANISLTGRENSIRSLTLKADSFAFSSPKLGDISASQVRGIATLRPDNSPVSATLSGRQLNVSRGAIASLQANGVTIVLSSPNPRQAASVSVNVKSQGLVGSVQGRDISGTKIEFTIDGTRTANSFLASQVAASASRFAYDFKFNTGAQAVDTKDLKLFASQFNRQRNNIPSTLALSASELELGKTQSSLFKGRAVGINAEATNLGSGYARLIGTVDSVTSNASLASNPNGLSRAISFDVLQTGPASGQLNRLQAQSLSLTVAGISVATAGLSASGNLTKNSFTNASIASNSVEITQTAQLPRPFKAENVQLQGSFGMRTAALDAFSLSHRGVDLAGRANIALAAVGSPRVDLIADVNGAFSVETLLSAWPRRFLPETRNTIARLVPAGTAQVGRLSLAIPAGMKRKQILPRSGMDLAFNLKDVTVTYLPGMSPITNVSGQGLLTGNSLLINLPQGSIGNIALAEGIVDISEFKPVGANVTIGAKISGYVSDMAHEIDLPPLAILTKANLDPARLSGSGTAALNLNIPMKPGLQPNDIGIEVSGAFQKAGLTRTFAGLNATNGNVHLEIDDDTIDISGQATLAGNLFDFKWGSSGRKIEQPKTTLTASGDVTVASLDALGLDVTSYANGPIRLNVTTNSEGATFGAAVINADFLNTDIVLPGDLWRKPVGVNGSASANLYPREGGGWNVQDLRFDSAGATLRGALDLSEDAKLVDARFSRVIIPNAGDLAVNATPGPNGLTVTLRGEYLNLSPFLKTKNVSEKAVDLFDRPLTLSADIKRVATSDVSALTNVHADIVRDNQGWRTLSANGDSPAGSSQIKLMVERDGRRSVSGVLSDAGFFAQLLYPGAPIFGGTGVIDGELPVVGANSSGILSFKGKDISLARGNGSPILFENVELPMSVRGGVVTLRDGQADGNAYTVKASGYVDVGAGRLDLRGVATPGGLNRVLADIPLFGAILGGGADEGLLGITFSAKGSMTAPRINVNPISALAPGFLRKLFESEAPLSPQPRLVVTTIAGDPIVTKWPYGPSEDMSEVSEPAALGFKLGPIQ